MLLNFKISNYRSIKDIDVDFSFAEMKAPNRYKELSYHPFIGSDKVRVVPCLALYGANASGKSNVIMALKIFQRIVIESLSDEFYEPNILQDCTDVISFQLSFYHEKKTFTYTLAYDSKQIVKELLECDHKKVFEITSSSHDFNNLNNFAYFPEKLEEIFNIEALDKNKLFKKPFLSILAKNYANLNEDITLAHSDISEKLEIYSSNNLSFNFVINKITDINNKKEVIKVFDWTVALLKKLDIGITKMEYDKNKFAIEDINIYRLNYANEEIEMPFGSESFGVKKLISLLALLLHILDNGLVLVIDELENSIHPLLLTKIIRLFKDKRYNKNNAQLVFATHNTDVMDHELMRISEIGIINKTLKNGTTMVRVSDFEGVRNVTRFQKQYLAGQFTGIPYPYI